MKETKKVILEQDGKRMTLEQGVEGGTATPQWDAMANKLKEGTAEKATLFGNAFMRTLAPAFLIITTLMILSLLICGR